MDGEGSPGVLPFTVDVFASNSICENGRHSVWLCLYWLAHQAPVDSSKPTVTQMDGLGYTQQNTKQRESGKRIYREGRRLRGTRGR